jgi:hypothetical protein
VTIFTFREYRPVRRRCSDHDQEREKQALHRIAIIVAVVAFAACGGNGDADAHYSLGSVKNCLGGTPEFIRINVLPHKPREHCLQHKQGKSSWRSAAIRKKWRQIGNALGLSHIQAMRRFREYV